MVFLRGGNPYKVLQLYNKYNNIIIANCLLRICSSSSRSRGSSNVSRGSTVVVVVVVVAAAAAEVAADVAAVAH